MAVALSHSIHIYARPDTKERLFEFFSRVLGLPMRELPMREAAKTYIQSPQPMYAATFPNGAHLSVEFAEDALSDEQARRAPWLELTTDDEAGLRQKAEAFGLKRVVHPYTPFFYVQAPGGQVFRIVSSTQ